MANLHFGRSVPIIFHTFPKVGARNLYGERIRIPEELRGSLNMLLISFKPWQLEQVDGWRTSCEMVGDRLSVKHRRSDVYEFYQVLVFQRWKWPFQWFLHWRYRRKIPQEWHRRTLVIYTSVRSFVNSMNLPDPMRNYALLIDPSGQIEWGEHEEVSTEKLDYLCDLLSIEREEPAPEVDDESTIEGSEERTIGEAPLSLDEGTVSGGEGQGQGQGAPAEAKGRA
ncbi:unnamed protein product [Vitrella brassicaformis CCMP3155]|uniref:Uncharacterized protein n=2 Tax=Vitrella brassicaformis TaxID=1169539 RepID=A0A0G4FWV1_VITBC|nr:unnamed protein product [Vitrella brassicaformis CCMP3155]|mmetsp:Transcript_2129/g.4826  ORF Transcript_2129/g.4826 Transcript_2129/m.4826 type:complete len:225 (+) Transcript_2129:123-797(+)|eukprot:CEM19627.1 unnamed protein product [Vitrella brassicaformis CCMP3155]